MSTDQLQALSNTVAGILSEPPSPPTFFDDEPLHGGKGGDHVAKAFDGSEPAAEGPRGKFGKLAPSEPSVVRSTDTESFGRAPEQVRAAAPADAGRQPVSKLEVASLRSDTQTVGIDTPRSAVSSDGVSGRGWVLRCLAGILLAAGIGIAFVTWLRPSGDAAKASLESTPPTLTVSTAVPPELTASLQSMSRDLANLGKEIEQLKLGRDQLARVNANLGEQLKTTQEQLTRAVAGLSDQLKASQERAERDNANAAEQIKAIKEQLSRLEQNVPPKTVAPPPRAATPAPRKPAAAPSSPQAAAQPVAAKPKPPATATSTSRPPAPAR